MLRSMYAAVSGLKNFQTQLDVIGNNIANVGTTGFKKGRVNFQDLLSQQISGSSAPTFNRGGVNPIQVGLGSKVGSIDTITEQGNLQTTGRSLDMAISGDGYFVVRDGFNQYYTRAGNFYLDKNGNLVNSDGLKLMGYGLNDKGVIDNSKLTNLRINDDSIHQPTTDSLTFTGNYKPSELITGNSMTGTITNPFKIYDVNGKSHDATIELKGNNSYLKPIDPQDATKGNYISQMDFTITSDNHTIPGTITFKPDGTVDSVNPPNGEINYGGTDGKVDFKDLDFSTLSLVDSMPSNAKVVGDTASLNSFSIGSSGEVYGVLSDGSVQLLGQVALSQFNNPDGLNKAGGNLFSASSNSGTPTIGTPADGGATISPGALEMSNVDLSEEFTAMIEAQRGFQANARVITTADQILQELVSLKR